MEGCKGQRDGGLQGLRVGEEKEVPGVLKFLLVFAFITHATIDSGHCLPPVD